MEQYNKYKFSKDLVFSYDEEEQRLSLYASSVDKLLIIGGAVGLLLYSLEDTESIDFNEFEEALIQLCPHLEEREIKFSVSNLYSVLIENEIISK